MSKILIGGSMNVTTMMHQIAERLVRYDCRFTPFYADGPVLSTLRRLGMLDNDFPHRNYVLAATSCLRENLKYENRKEFITRSVAIAQRRKLRSRTAVLRLDASRPCAGSA